ncbi:ATP-binding cassette sub-family G member 1, partial [Fragariocoptes setiger]
VLTHQLTRQVNMNVPDTDRPLTMRPTDGLRRASSASASSFRRQCKKKISKSNSTTKATIRQPHSKLLKSVSIAGISFYSSSNEQVSTLSSNAYFSSETSAITDTIMNTHCQDSPKNVSEYGSSDFTAFVSPSMYSLSNSDGDNFPTHNSIISTDKLSPDKILFRRSTSSNESDRTLAISIRMQNINAEHDSEHFEIVWRNLSYQVPLKFSEQVKRSFSKLRTYVTNINKCSYQPQVSSTQAHTTIAQHQQQQQQHQRDSSFQNKLAYPRAQFDVPHNLAYNNNSSRSSSSSISSPTVASSIYADNTRRRVIFSHLNGCIRSGQVTAILGPSGAGKTTFLKCLTGRISKGITGSIEVCGNDTRKHRKLRLCMIPQRDYLLEHLTVKENLMFASKIKNAEGDFDHAANVERVVQMLRLASCLHLKTGKISGGQHKRVSIAQELLSNPDILVLDEPTSGLDSLTCYKTVYVLQDLANLSRKGLISPLAIVLTIHQPQTKIFKLFHHVYVISSLGQCIYEGRPEDVADTIKESCSLVEPLTDGNPASFIIEIASEEHGTEPILALASLQRQNFYLDWRLSGDDSGHSSSSSSDLGPNNSSKNLTEPVDDCIIVSRSPDHLNLAASKTMTPFEPLSFVNGDSTKSKQSSINVMQYDVSSDNKSQSSNSTLYDKFKFRSHTTSNRGRHKKNRLPLKWHADKSAGFWHHVQLLTYRTWLSMWRDPLLTSTRIFFHLIIPFVMAVVYSPKSGIANACPNLEREFDVRTMASPKNVQQLQEQHNELILTFENTSLFFILLYSFSMCVLALTSLSFPLNMHILAKESGNGWYSLPRFVMAKTLADLPMELTMPLLTMSLVYPLTNQPSSYMNWRMLSITLVMTMCSLISQTQGLIFGALFMNNVQTAVFVSQASSLPWILLSGFTTRVSELTQALRLLSFGSVYRLGIESILSIRYGFGMCPCDKDKISDTPAHFVGIPPQVSSVFKYWMETYRPEDSDSVLDDSNNSTITTGTSMITNITSTSAAPTLVNSTTDSSAPSNQQDLFAEMASYLSRANTFGVDIESCHDVRPFILNARDIDEDTLPKYLIGLVLILLLMKVLLFILVKLR